MVINKGLDPPDMEGEYLASPYELSASNVPDDYSLGTIFADYYFRLYDQDNDDLTIKLDYYNGGETVPAWVVLFPVMEINFLFSLKWNRNTTVIKPPCFMSYPVPWAMTGIEDFYFTNYMLDNNDNEGGVWIENDEGRVLIDSDGDSPFTDYEFKSTKSHRQSVISGAGKVEIDNRFYHL